MMIVIFGVLVGWFWSVSADAVLKEVELGIGWAFGRSFKGLVDPLPEVAIGKEVPAQQSHQVRQRPGQRGAELQILEQEHGDQCCPNLEVYGVGTGAYEGLHFEVLFEGLEEELDLPAIFVDGGDSGGAEIKQIGEQHDFPFVIRIPHDKAAQRSWAVALSLGARELDDLIGADTAFCGTSNSVSTVKTALSFRRVTKKTPARVQRPNRA